MPSTAPKKQPASTADRASTSITRFFRAYHAITLDLPSRVSPTACFLAQVVLSRTLGIQRSTGTEPPEWADLSEKQYAEIIHGEAAVRAAAESDPPRDLLRGIRKALDEVCQLANDPKYEGPALPLERRKVGQRYEYRLAPDCADRIKGLSIREPRAVPKLKEEKPPVEAPAPVALPCPLGETCPHELLEEIGEGEVLVKINTGTAVPVSGARPGQVAAPQTGTAVPVSAGPQGVRGAASAPAGPAAKAANGNGNGNGNRNSSSGISHESYANAASVNAASANAVSSQIAAREADLRAMLLEEIVVRRVIIESPEDSMVRAINEALGSAPIDDLRMMIRQKQRKITSWPFIRDYLAPTCARAWQDAQVFFQPSAPIQFPTPQFREDTEENDWTRIKRVLAETLSAENFENWIRRSRLERRENGTLHVATPTSAAAEYIRQEFFDQVTAAAEQAGVRVKRIEFRAER